MRLAAMGGNRPPALSSSGATMPYKGAPSIKDYTRFHGMLIGSRSAKRCIDSFTGKVIFMPSCYSRTRDFPPVGSDTISPWEVEGLNLAMYYALVAFSLTGLSTLLGLTQTIDSRESDNLSAESGDELPTLKSHKLPRLEVDDVVLEYLVQGDDDCSVRLVRRFEFNFRLCLLKVVMLHFVTLDPWNQVVVDDGGQPLLHLVEVWEVAGGLRPDQLKLLVGGAFAAVISAVAAMLAVGRGMHTWQPHMHIGEVLHTGVPM